MASTLHEVQLGFGTYGNFDFSGPLLSPHVLYRVTGVGFTEGSQTWFIHPKRLAIAPALTWVPDAKTSLTFLTNYSLKPITQLLPSFILMKADEARTLALRNTVQALASEMAEQALGSEVVATRLAEVLFIQVLRAHIASGPERNKGCSSRSYAAFRATPCLDHLGRFPMPRDDFLLPCLIGQEK